MTRDEALKWIGLIPSRAIELDLGMGAGANTQYADALKRAFPEFNWRIILDRSGGRTRWALTIDDNDPREHYFGRLGAKCVHCGKTARELAVPEEERDETD